MYAVDPPSSIFRVSSGTPSNARRARRTTCRTAHAAFWRVAATSTTQSSSAAPTAERSAATSSPVTP